MAKKKKQSLETERMRLERVSMHKTTTTRVIRDKTKYNRKKDNGRQYDGHCCLKHL